MIKAAINTPRERKAPFTTSHDPLNAPHNPGLTEGPPP